MGFLDELKRLTHPYEDEMEDDYDEDEDVYEDEEEPEDVEPTPPPREEPSAVNGNTRSRPAAIPAARW